MFGKRKRLRAQLEEQMAKLENLTAELIGIYSTGDWDLALVLAERLELLLKPIATMPRMEICLYHVESIQLRIAYKRKDIGLIETMARKSHNLQVSDLATRTVMRMATYSSDNLDRDRLSVDSILRESESELRTMSDAESQIVHMRNPNPRLIGTRWLPDFYRT
ncbi:hypothetical protein [Amycolatopsis taiwanensis]|uniref:Uncharacterized protein n=1 Tax=Amycolatopsis taiwanensis TaxID=342230 RepID=A0A9W6R5M7_9PSEU|nr:hypothetical protein [Amycolatopsis taiwanensis]GLY68790.1 hypothetical protein Atai01_54090 [Amycolatopsis taiwanensis]